MRTSDLDTGEMRHALRTEAVLLRFRSRREVLPFTSKLINKLTVQWNNEMNG